MNPQAFENFKKLIMQEPCMDLPMIANENCEYNSFLYQSKNCYLSFGSSYLQDCMHCDTCTHCSDCADTTYSRKCELCYECVDCLKSYGCTFSQDLNNCTDCWFCFDCIGCTDCFGCVGLRRQKYHLFNKKLTQEEYQAKVADLKSGLSDPEKRMEIENRFQELQESTPRVYMRGHNNEKVFGDYTNDSKNCYMSFNVSESEDCFYAYDEVYKDKDCIDITHCTQSELCYDTTSCDLSYGCNCMFVSVGNRDCEYCVWCEQCEECFMCKNLKHKKFHILNKPYSKEDYHKKLAKIKEELSNAGLLGQNLIYLAMGEDTPTKFESYA